MRDQRKTLFDAAIINNPQAAIDFITNILESSTEYSVIAKDLDGKILLWNEGARRLYGYEPEEVVGKMNSSVLHTPGDVEAGLPKKIMMDALEQGKFEGTVSRRRKNGNELPPAWLSRRAAIFRASQSASSSFPRTSRMKSVWRNMHAA
jgi:PAS domain S-box-containing protein